MLTLKCQGQNSTSGQGHVVTLIGYVACQSMHLDERNTLKPLPLLYLYQRLHAKKNAYDLMWPRIIWRRGHGVNPIYGSSRMAWHKAMLRYLALSPSYFWKKKHLNIFLLPYNGLVRKLTWPQVTDIQILRYTFCRYWCPNQNLKFSCWSLKNCSLSTITNICGIWVTWPDLRWPRAKIFRKGAERMYEKVCEKGGTQRRHFFPIHKKL